MAIGLVVGFLFSEDFSYVVLIEKSKPEWQAGRLNGVGGKIEEGEEPLDAMRREFKEEAGLDIQHWIEFAHLSDARDVETAAGVLSTVALSGKAPRGRVEQALVHLKPAKFDLHVFYATGPATDARSMEAEPVRVVYTPAVIAGEFKTIGNLPWLITLARQVALGEERCRMFRIEELEAR